MWCWMNGEVLRAEDIKISPFDHGFLYGAGFFETFRTYGGNVFLFDEHMDRLKAALSEYRIMMSYCDAEILASIQCLNECSKNIDGYFRLNVSAGVHEIGLTPSSYTSPNVILFRKELAPTVRGVEKKAMWLETPRNLPESSVRHKSHNFLNNVRGRLELPSLKEMEGLFVTEDNFVAEGVTSNVFWVKGGELFTPAIGTGILPGITRAFIIKLAKSVGFIVNEGFYGKEHVENADEVFVTNAVQELVPLSGIEGFLFSGASGEFYQKLHELYIQAINARKEGDG